MSLKVSQYLKSIESSFAIPLKENDLLKVDDRLNHPVSPKTLFKEQLRVDFSLRKREAYQSIRGNRSIRQIKTVKPLKTSCVSTTTPETSPEAFASLMEVRRIFKAIRNGSDTKSESDFSSSRNSSPEIASDSDSE